MLVGSGGALTTMEETGTAVGFSDCKEKEGVGPVGVGNRDERLVPEARTLEPAELPMTEEVETEEVETAEVETAEVELPLLDEVAANAVLAEAAAAT